MPLDQGSEAAGDVPDGIGLDAHSVEQCEEQDGWNYYFRMNGPHIVLFLNGVKTAEGDDPGGFASGPSVSNSAMATTPLPPSRTST
jgi:hypothetical protein